MLTLIRNGRLFAPDDKGARDILIAGDRIVRIDNRIDLPPSLMAQTVEAEGQTITPGFIDLQVHIIGGGGEGGPATRIPLPKGRISYAGNLYS